MRSRADTCSSSREAERFLCCERLRMIAVLRTKHGMSVEADNAVAQEGTSGELGTRERTVILDTMREVLFEILGFRALAERRIPPELVAPGGPTEAG